MSILPTCEAKNWILQHSRDQKNVDRPTELRKIIIFRNTATGEQNGTQA